MIVLDTHIWLWWVNNDNQNLKPEWMSRIQSSEEMGVSAISCFEVAWLERHNRIVLRITYYLAPDRNGLKKHWRVPVFPCCR